MEIRKQRLVHAWVKVLHERNNHRVTLTIHDKSILPKPQVRLLRFRNDLTAVSLIGKEMYLFAESRGGEVLC